MFWIILIFGLVSRALGGGIGTAWDISPGKHAEATTHQSWSRPDLKSAFEVRTITGVGHPQSSPGTSGKKDTRDFGNDRNAKELEDMSGDYTPEIFFDHPVFKGVFRKPRKEIDVEMIPSDPWEKTQSGERTWKNRQSCPESLEEGNSAETPVEHPRLRRETDESKMEKISGTKSVREPRMNAPESWSQQPLSVEFRHRTNLDGLPGDENDERSAYRAHQEAPHVDFVTANRRNFDEVRESRDLSPKFYDDMYRNNFNNLRDSRDLDASYPRGYYYPGIFRTEREYLIRGLNEPTAFSQERYRIEDFDMYPNRPTPKPKRIIYYATLPEVVRKPVDLRSYTRPYDSMRRASIPSMHRDSVYKKLPGGTDPRYQYRNPPYGGMNDGYDNYMRGSSYFDRPYMNYDRLEEDRYREQDLDHASFKEAPRNEEDSRQSVTSDSRTKEKSPWPVQVGTEVNIKDTERISGRKIYGQHEDYDRFRPSARVEQSSEESTGNKRE